MKPKNSKERRNSFLKFLALFLFTVAMVVTAVYFNFKVPNKENQILKAQALNIKKEMDFQNNFNKEMSTVKNMIDSMDVPGQNISYQNSLISTKLVDMQKMIPTKDSTYRYDMYTNIVGLYIELQETKDRLRSLEDAESTIQEYKEAFEKCKDDYKEVERELYILRRSN